MQGTVRSFRNVFLIAIPTFLEFFLARYILHSIFELKIGWGWFVSDYDLFVPSLMGLLLALFLLERAKPPLLGFSLFRFLRNLGTLILFLAVSKVSPGSVFWWLVFGALAFTSLTVFVPDKFYFSNSNRMAIPFCLLIALSQVIYQHTFPLLWPFLFPKTAHISCGFLQSFFGNALRCGFDGTEFYHLEHPMFRIVLGVGCGGFDGIFFFLFASVLFFLLNRTKISSWQIPLIVVTGLVSMFFLNVIRIVFLFFLGFVLVHFLPPREAYPIVTKTFHLNLGWILYSLFIGFYFRGIYLLLTLKRAGLKQMLSQNYA